jgi:hypothetical protein
MPVILILFAASHRRAYWLWVQDYFGKEMARQPKPGAKSVRVHVPQRQPVTRRAIAAWRRFKQQVRQRSNGGES